MNNLYLNLPNYALKDETYLERDLKVEISKCEGKLLLKLMQKYGHPKNEFEEDKLWDMIEERTNNNKKIKEKVNKLLFSGDF